MHLDRARFLTKGDIVYDKLTGVSIEVHSVDDVFGQSILSGIPNFPKQNPYSKYLDYDLDLILADKEEWESKKFYFAGYPYKGRRLELAIIKHIIESYGHKVVSTWIDSYPQPINRSELAEKELKEIDECDCLMAFTEDPETAHYKGGRHVEYGYAIAKHKDIIVVGPKENLFYWLPTNLHFRKIEDLVRHLGAADIWSLERDGIRSIH